MDLLRLYLRPSNFVSGLLVQEAEAPMNAFLVTAPVLTHRAPPRSATIEARRGCSGMAPCGPIVFSHETRLTPRRSWSRNRAQTAVVSPASSWSAYAPGHEGKSRAGSPSMTTACGGHRSYRLPLAPVRAGAPSRRPARSSLRGELGFPPFSAWTLRRPGFGSPARDATPPTRCGRACWRERRRPCCGRAAVRAATPRP